MTSGKSMTHTPNNQIPNNNCGVLLPINTSDCPPNTYSINNPFFLPNCQIIDVGDLCEGDGECGTNHFLNNCQCGIFFCDVYIKINLNSFIPTNQPTNQPTNLPSTDPCQTYDNNIICPVYTNYSDCFNPVIKAVCPYLCGGCVSISPTQYMSPNINLPTITPSILNTNDNINILDNLSSKNIKNEENKNSFVLITGISSFVTILLILFI